MARTEVSVISSLVNEAIETTIPTITLPPSESEAHAYKSLEQISTQGEIQNKTAEVQVTKIIHNKNVFALLFQSPEPIDWKRINFEVREWWIDELFLPRFLFSLKLTNVDFGTISLINSP